MYFVRKCFINLYYSMERAESSTDHLMQQSTAWAEECEINRHESMTSATKYKYMRKRLAYEVDSGG